MTPIKYIFTEWVGRTVGQLTVVEQICFKGRGYWICDCTCGKRARVAPSHLCRGKLKSCGCSKPLRRGENGNNWCGFADFPGALLSGVRYRAARKNLPFDLTSEFLWKLYLQQDRKCALTGYPIDFQNKSPYKASIDRIDATKGYVQDNVQWVCKDINYMKHTLSQDKFIKLCKAVITTADA
jgi:hypothetical protein